MTEPTIVTLADPEACSLAAAERIIEILDVAIDDHGEAHWVTTGGSTPAAIYRNLRQAAAARRDRLAEGPPVVDRRPVRAPATTPCRMPRSPTRSSWAAIVRASPASGGVPIPVDQVHPFETSVAIGEGHDAGLVRRIATPRTSGPTGPTRTTTAGRSST